MSKKPARKFVLRGDPQLLSQIAQVENEVRQKNKQLHIRKSNVQHGDLLPKQLSSRVRRLIDLNAIENQGKEQDDLNNDLDDSNQSIVVVPETRYKVMRIC